MRQAYKGAQGKQQGMIIITLSVSPQIINKSAEAIHLAQANRDAHSKDFQPIFDQFSLQLLFNFTANLTFFAVKMNENWPKIGYHDCPGQVILEKQVKIGLPEGVQLSSLNGTLPYCRWYANRWQASVSSKIKFELENETQYEKWHSKMEWELGFLWKWAMGADFHASFNFWLIFIWKLKWKLE